MIVLYSPVDLNMHVSWHPDPPCLLRDALMQRFLLALMTLVAPPVRSMCMHVDFFLPSPDAYLHSDPYVGMGGGNGGKAGGESSRLYGTHCIFPMHQYAPQCAFHLSSPHVQIAMLNIL